MREIPNKFLIKSWEGFILDGNQRDLSVVYHHFFDSLFTYGLKHTSNVQFVEDSIQDLFFYLIKNRKKIGEAKNLNAYIISSFRRRLFIILNAQKKSILVEQVNDIQFDYLKSTDQSISEKEDLEKVYNAVKQSIRTLTPKQQEIIYLRFECAVSYEEISKMLNISVDSCYKSVYRSVRIVRSKVEDILQKTNRLFLLSVFGIWNKQ